MRIGEAWRLDWDDIDFTRRTVSVTAEKGSDPRILRLSDARIGMLQTIQAGTRAKRVFRKSLESSRRLFYNFRRRIGEKLKNSRIVRITFHSFRRRKATDLYHQTNDILYVTRLLGHKRIKNTLIYVQPEEVIYDKRSDEYIS